MYLLDLGKRVLAKQVERHEKNEAAGLPRKDAGLPLGARVGGVIEVNKVPFLLLENSLAKGQDAAHTIIQAVGRLKLEADRAIPLYRFYFATEPAQFLQVLGNEHDIEEIVLYNELFSYPPETEEEQRAFMGQGYGLGEREFTFGREQLENAGIPSAKIDELFAGGEGLTYTRDITGDDYVPPMIAEEKRIDDAAGTKGAHKKVWFTPYVRTLADGTLERLLISFEVIDSLDGNETTSVSVSFMIGIALEVGKIKVF